MWGPCCVSTDTPSRVCNDNFYIYVPISSKDLPWSSPSPLQYLYHRGVFNSQDSITPYPRLPRQYRVAFPIHKYLLYLIHPSIFSFHRTLPTPCHFKVFPPAQNQRIPSPYSRLHHLFG